MKLIFIGNFRLDRMALFNEAKKKVRDIFFELALSNVRAYKETYLFKSTRQGITSLIFAFFLMS